MQKRERREREKSDINQVYHYMRFNIKNRFFNETWNAAFDWRLINQLMNFFDSASQRFSRRLDLCVKVERFPTMLRVKNVYLCLNRVCEIELFIQIVDGIIKLLSWLFCSSLLSCWWQLGCSFQVTLNCTFHYIKNLKKCCRVDWKLFNEN